MIISGEWMSEQRWWSTETKKGMCVRCGDRSVDYKEQKFVCT